MLENLLLMLMAWDVMICPIDLLGPKRFSRFGAVSEIFQILVKPICQHHSVLWVMRAWVKNRILTAELLNSIPVCSWIALNHHLFSLLLPVHLPLESVLLLLLLLPLFVCNASHDPLIGLRLLFSIFVVLLLLVSKTLFYGLISLLEKGLFQPLFENFVSGFLLCLFMESFEFILLVFHIATSLFFQAFLVLPLHHSVMFFLPSDFLSRLGFTDLLKNVTLFFSDKLFFKFDLVLLFTHPFFMRNSSCTALTNLTSLLDRYVILCCIFASWNMRLIVEVGQ